jgi:hypothetical protein
MSTNKQSVPGAAEGARRATGEAPGTGRHGEGRWSAKRKMARSGRFVGYGVLLAA